MNRKGILLFVLLLVIMMSCTSVPSKYFFMIYYRPIKPVFEKTHNISLEIKPLNILPVYDSYRIVHRYSLYELQYYSYQLWAGKPEDMLTNLLYKHFLYSKLVKDVRKIFLDKRADYTLIGNITSIEQVEEENSWFAHLAINFSLVDNRNNLTVWNYSLDAQQEVYTNDFSHVAKAISDIMERGMEEILVQLDEVFSKEDGK